MKLGQVRNSTLLWGILNREALKNFIEKDLLALPEARPYLYGLRNIALLKREGFPCFYCTDNMLGTLFSHGKIRRSIIFYREENEKGFICPSGSLYIYLLSKLHKVEVRFFPQGELEDCPDKDASSLEGRLLISREDVDFVIKPQDEFIEKEKLEAKDV